MEAFIKQQKSKSMKFTLYAISKNESGSYTETLVADTDAEIKECVMSFMQSADKALKRWYLEYDDIDTENASQSQLDYLEELLEELDLIF